MSHTIRGRGVSNTIRGRGKSHTIRGRGVSNTIRGRGKSNTIIWTGHLFGGFTVAYTNDWGSPISVEVNKSHRMPKRAPNLHKTRQDQPHHLHSPAHQPVTAVTFPGLTRLTTSLAGYVKRSLISFLSGTMKTCPLHLIERGEPRAMSEHPGGEGGGGGEGEEEGKGRGTKRGRWSQIRIPRYTQDGGQSYMCGNSRSCSLTMTPLATE